MGQGEILLDKTMRYNYLKLQTNFTGSNRKQTLFYIKNSWKTD